MKNQEPSELAIAAAKKQARQYFAKYAQGASYQAGVTLKEDQLTALLARAFEAGLKAQTRS